MNFSYKTILTTKNKEIVIDILIVFLSRCVCNHFCNHYSVVSIVSVVNVSNWPIAILYCLECKIYISVLQNKCVLICYCLQCAKIYYSVN